MSSFADYVTTYSDSDSEIPYLISKISSSVLDSEIKKKHIFHAIVLRWGETSRNFAKTVLELYLFDKEGLKTLKYLNCNFILRSSLDNFRLRDYVAEMQSRLFLRRKGFDFFGINTYNNLDISDENLLIEEVKNFDTELARLNFWSNNDVIVLRKPEDYSINQRLEIIEELNNLLNPFNI